MHCDFFDRAAVNTCCRSTEAITLMANHIWASKYQTSSFPRSWIHSVSLILNSTTPVILRFIFQRALNQLQLLKNTKENKGHTIKVTTGRQMPSTEDKNLYSGCSVLFKSCSLAHNSLGFIIKWDFGDTNAGLRWRFMLTMMRLCLLISLSFAQRQSAKVYSWAGEIENKLERGQSPRRNYRLQKDGSLQHSEQKSDLCSEGLFCCISPYLNTCAAHNML